jgi:hypothetical protein
VGDVACQSWSEVVYHMYAEEVCIREVGGPECSSTFVVITLTDEIIF